MSCAKQSRTACLPISERAELFGEITDANGAADSRSRAVFKAGEDQQPTLACVRPPKYNSDLGLLCLMRRGIVATEALLSIVDSLGYRALIDGLAYGKKLPTAVYVHREAPVCSSGPLGDIVRRLAEAHGIGDDFNVVKFRRDAPRLSFLSYPGFHDRAHPELSKAIAIDLSTGKLFKSDYGDSLNPPILHKKELLLAPDHPRSQEYADLSAKEGEAGLYHDTTLRRCR